MRIALVALALASACALATAAPPFPFVYEISTRPWLFALSKQYGGNVTLANIPDQELARIAGAGFHVVWMMGVWELGSLGLQHDRTDPGLLSGYRQLLPDFTLDDVIGSPYAVVNYTCNPSIGTDADLRALRGRLARHGLQLMLDFVPNHSAVDCAWTTTRPELYVQGDASCPPSQCVQRGGRVLYFGGDVYNKGWTDTCQFNYWNPDTVAAQAANLLRVASMADWVRCDMSHDILNAEFERAWGGVVPQARPGKEFWQVAIQSVRQQYPGVRLIAETYNYGFNPQPEDVTLRQLGFDFTYQKDVLDLLEGNNLDNIRGFVQQQGSALLAGAVHFTENHDEPRAALALGGGQQACAGTALALTLPGLRLVNFGQELGYRNRLDVHLRRAAAEGTDTHAASCYEALFRVVTAPVFVSGSWSYLGVGSSDTAWRLVAWKWVAGEERRLVVVNYSDQTAGGAIVLSDAPQPASGDMITVTELMTSTPYSRSASDLRSSGLFVVLGAWSVQIFQY